MRAGFLRACFSRPFGLRPAAKAPACVGPSSLISPVNKAASARLVWRLLARPRASKRLPKQALILLAALAAGCRPEAVRNPESRHALAGRVIFSGAPPQDARRLIPEAGEIEAHTLIVDPKTRGVKNAAVWIEGLEDSAPPPPSSPSPAMAPVMDQINYTFVPHVLAVRKGEEVLFLSSDTANHNIHARALEPENQFNIMISSAREYRHRFIRPRRLPAVMIGCDLHAWMRAWIYVFNHPWFAVTRPDGGFQIGGLPPGNHRLVVQHADAGLRREVEVSVPGLDPGGATIEFTDKDLEQASADR